MDFLSNDSGALNSFRMCTYGPFIRVLWFLSLVWYSADLIVVSYIFTFIKNTLFQYGFAESSWCCLLLKLLLLWYYCTEHLFFGNAGCGFMVMVISHRLWVIFSKCASIEGFLQVTCQELYKQPLSLNCTYVNVFFTSNELLVLYIWPRIMCTFFFGF